MDDRRSRSPGAARVQAGWSFPEEDDARAARERLRAGGIVPMEVDGPVRATLEPGEIVVTLRRGVVARDACDPDGRLGDLYVTDRRLVHVGPAPFACALGEIHEVAMTSERLLLFLADGRGIAIVVEDPGVLRVELAAAREAARRPAKARAGGDGQVPSR